MNFLTIGIGLLAIAYGIFVLVLRVQGKNDGFKKLVPMQKFWGQKLGSFLHVIGYIVIPILVGVTIIISGICGLGIDQFLR